MTAARRIAIIKDWFRALAEGEYERMHDYHTDDVVWELMPGPAEGVVPWLGVYRGRAGVQDCLGRFSGAVESERFETGAPLIGDETIAVPGHTDLIARASGRRFRIEFVEYFCFRGDRIASVKVYGDTAAAREALGGV
jgi:ketosteroid isomerase-like protein